MSTSIAPNSSNTPTTNTQLNCSLLSSNTSSSSSTAFNSSFSSSSTSSPSSSDTQIIEPMILDTLDSSFTLNGNKMKSTNNKEGTMVDDNGTRPINESNNSLISQVDPSPEMSLNQKSIGDDSQVNPSTVATNDTQLVSNESSSSSPTTESTDHHNHHDQQQQQQNVIISSKRPDCEDTSIDVNNNNNSNTSNNIGHSQSVSVIENCAGVANHPPSSTSTPIEEHSVTSGSVSDTIHSSDHSGDSHTNNISLSANVKVEPLSPGPYGSNQSTTDVFTKPQTPSTPTPPPSQPPVRSNQQQQQQQQQQQLPSSGLTVQQDRQSQQHQSMSSMLSGPTATTLPSSQQQQQQHHHQHHNQQSQQHSSNTATSHTALMDYHTNHHHSPALSGHHGQHSQHGHGHQSMVHGQAPPQSQPPSQTILSMAAPTLSSMSPNISVVTVASSSPSSDPKDCIEEQCPVCGDRVSGYHYGLLTCESCKGFFKRTVQNKKVYTCVAERSCHIDKSQRKRCPFCRFQKCLDVGMKLEAVRADRMRGGRNKFGPMYKRDRARRLQIMRQKQLTKAQIVGHGHGGGGGGNGGHHHHPSGATMLPGGELNFLGSGHGGGHHGGHGPTTTIFDGVKQELIQIPQLSSSTSSPDSSPSPGSTGPGGVSQLTGGPLGAVAAAAAAAAAAVAGGGGGGGVGHHDGNSVAHGTNHSQHHTQHSFMPQLSITAHPMTSTSGSSNPATNQSMMNPAAAAAAAVAADQLLKSWSNNGGPNTANNGNNSVLPGTSKNNSSSLYHETTNVGGVPSLSDSKYLPPLIREFQSSMLDDKEWQAQLFGLLNNQTYNQCEVDLFELMCKVIDQSLFSQVDWARNSIFFKDLKVDDQMKLLQHAWSDMLVLDHIHQRMHVGLPDETTLPNGQKFDLLSLALLGVPACSDAMHRVTARLQELKLDTNDYICLKFLLLLNPEVRGLTNYKLVQEAHEQTKQALHSYSQSFYPNMDKYQQLLALAPEIRALTTRGEDFLYFKHMNGQAPTQTLLMEMLHAKKK